VGAFFAGWLAWIVGLAGELHPLGVVLCILGGALLAGLQRALAHVIGRYASPAQVPVDMGTRPPAAPE
jgi:hypothetical protein